MRKIMITEKEIENLFELRKEGKMELFSVGAAAYGFSNLITIIGKMNVGMVTFVCKKSNDIPVVHKYLRSRFKERFIMKGNPAVIHARGFKRYRVISDADHERCLEWGTDPLIDVLIGDCDESISHNVSFSVSSQVMRQSAVRNPYKKVKRKKR